MTYPDWLVRVVLVSPSGKMKPAKYIVSLSGYSRLVSGDTESHFASIVVRAGAQV
jgi:hypothetical protein